MYNVQLQQFISAMKPFLAPTGAQGVTMSVRPSVRLSARPAPSQSIFIFLGQRSNREQSQHSENDQRTFREHSQTLREHSESTQRALRDYSQSNQNIKIRVIQQEPLNTASCSDVNGTSINVVAGHSATLPCDTSTGRTSSREQPSLILWFKEEDGKPIFR